jgi:hypothetical protein
MNRKASRRTAKPADWSRRTTHVQPGEITDAMLEPLRRQMTSQYMPRTVWPSRHFGTGFAGTDCLLTLDSQNAAEGSEPFCSLLPSLYYPTWRAFIAATAAGGERCSGCGHSLPAGPAFVEPGSDYLWCTTCVWRIEAAREGTP